MMFLGVIFKGEKERRREGEKEERREGGKEGRRENNSLVRCGKITDDPLNRTETYKAIVLTPSLLLSLIKQSMSVEEDVKGYHHHGQHHPAYYHVGLGPLAEFHHFGAYRG